MLASLHARASARRIVLRAIVTAACSILPNTILGQPVVTPWGNVTGVQVDGELMRFETALRAIAPDWSGFVQSSKYNWEGHPTYALEGKTYICTHFLEQTALHYSTRVTDTGVGTAEIELATDLKADLPMAGAFFVVNLPAEDYAGARIEFLDAAAQPLPTLTDHTGGLSAVARVRARGFRVTGPKRTLEVTADQLDELLVRQDFVSQPDYLNDPLPRQTFVRSDPKLKVGDFQIYFPVLPGAARSGAASHTRYHVKAGGAIDREPVHLALDATQPGRWFSGIGGNFRMQYPELDAQVVDYCFKNLNVTWGRIAFLWNEWQPEENSDGEKAALAGSLSPHFMAQVEIARTLAARKIPMVMSVWVPPDWAVDHSRPLKKGVKLDERKLQKSADSIAGFLLYLKNHYGIEPILFSFNETDYGVEIHQSPQEHARAIGVLGATFAARGLVTKLLLGDTGAGTEKAHEMVQVAEGDPALRPFLGAISFHNYHGLTDTDLKAWAGTARALNLPLLADEGGPDSAAHRYPLIWQTPWFAQLEIDQYVRIAATCQPLSVLPWQLNADYSLLAGGGIYGDHSALRPTQRFWCLKQFGALSGAYWLPVSADRGAIDCAALGDLTRGAYAIHIVNNGAARGVVVTGIPAGVKALQVVVTDAERSMKVVATKGVVDGKVSFQLEAQTFTSLLSNVSDL